MYIGAGARCNLGERAVQSLDSSSSVTLGTVYRCCGRLGDVVYVSFRRGRCVGTASWFGQLLGFWDVFLSDILVRVTFFAAIGQSVD